MDLDAKERDIVYLWGKITSLSRLEEIKRTKGKELVSYYLKTLEKMEVVLDNENWGALHVTKQDAVGYLQLFHSVYSNTITG